MELSRSFELTTVTILAVLLIVDLLIVARRPHVPSMREAALWVGFYVVLAGVFAGLLSGLAGGQVAGGFIAGWATEYSLSVDNLFIFMIIMTRFAVPRANQQKVLMIGIILSLVLRGTCILLGAAAIERFSAIFYLFGGFLVYTAVSLLRSGDVHEYEENRAVRQIRRRLPLSDGYDDARLVTRVSGRRVATPMVVVLLAIGSADLLFAFDSIPAIFGLTTHPFVVFTATLFALMGLRQLYFLLGGLLDRMVYLPQGLAVILAFIGAKLVLEALATNEMQWVNGGDPVEWAPVIPIWGSLAFIGTVLLVTAALSVLAPPKSHRALPAPRPELSSSWRG
ncbi:MAG TPA: TerC/Alx family metal homeostasis membrane protein [Kineosporiaceae bacterium]|nr:TerC/Alx family metal homeostasis membrane protein [Kineosporiaceae bacterium]